MVAFITLARILVTLSACLVICRADEDEYFKADKLGENNCNGTAVDLLDNAKLSIAINGTVADSGNVTCTWLLSDPKNATKQLLIVLNGLDDVNLHPDDSLVITSDDDKTVLANVTGSDLTKWGVILTDLQAKVKAKIVLKISPEAGKRKFKATYDRVSGAASFNYNHDHDYSIPINHIENSGSNALFESLEVTLALNKDTNPNSRLLVNFDQVIGNPQFTIDGVASPEFDLMNTDEPVKPIKITFKNLDFTKSRLVLGTQLVDKDCSSVVTLSSATPTQMLSLPATPEIGSAKNCLWLVRSDVPVKLDMSLTHSLYADDDLLQVRDGPRLMSSKVLCEVNGGNLLESEHGLGHSVSSQNLLRVSFTSKYVRSTTGMLGLKVSRAPNSKVWTNMDKSGDVQVTGSAAEPSPLFLFKAQLGNKAAFTSSKQVTQVNLTFFSSDEVDAKPFMTVVKGQMVPEKIVSPTSVLRISLNDTNASSVHGEFVSDNSLDSTAIGDSASVIVCDLGNMTSVSWLIPGRVVDNSAIRLNIHKLALLGDANNCIELTRIDSSLSSILKSCRDPKLTTVQATRSIPDILLNGTSSYVLKYTSNPGTSSNNGLLEASVSYSTSGCVRVNQTLNSSLTVNPETYPNNHVLIDPTMSNCGWYYNAGQTSMIHVTVEDLQLFGGNTLNLRGPNYNEQFTSRTLSPSDVVLRESLLLDPKWTLPSSPPSLESMTGRGFKITLNPISCGGTIDADSVKNLTTPGYPNMTAKGVTKCVWIVKAKPGSLLNITRNSVDPKLGQLVIWDNNSTRMNHWNESYVINGTFTTSVNETVITYTVTDPNKGAPGLLLNWTIDSCVDQHKAMNISGIYFACRNDASRCILPSWICNGNNDCGDWSDELYCNTTAPIPPPPKPDCPSGGVSGWVIVLVIIPMAICVGFLISKYGPTIMERWSSGRGRYSEFDNFGEVS